MTTVYRVAHSFVATVGTTLTDWWMPLYTTRALPAASSDALTRTRMGFSATVERLRTYVSANSSATTSTVTLYKNGVATAAQVSIPAGATGWFEDTSHSVAFSASDEGNLRIEKSSSTLYFRNTLWDVLSESGYHRSGSFNASSNAISSSAKYSGLYGAVGAYTSISNAISTYVNDACNLNFLTVYVPTNSRTGVTNIDTLKNGTNASYRLIVPAGATGTFEATAGSASFADGDSISFQVANASGTGTFYHTGISACLSSADGTVPVAGQVSAALSTNQTRYAGLLGITATTYGTDENAVSLKLHGTGTVKHFGAVVTTNAATDDTTVTARKNGVDQSPTFVIPAAATGYFEDASGSFTYADGDSVSIKVSRPSGGSGSITIDRVFAAMQSDQETVVVGGKVKVVLSGTPQAKPAKVSIGGSFVEKPVKFWNGTDWVLTSY